MKKILLAFISLICIICVSCKKPGTYVPSENAKADFHIELLFECDGVKMYRFYDNGNTRYFTTGNGRITDSKRNTGGRGNVVVDDTVIQ